MMNRAVQVFCLAALLWSLSGCRLISSDSLDQKVFPVINTHVSENFNSRIRQIVLHYTVIDFERSLAVLKGEIGPSVSAHYLINDQPNERFPNYIYRLLPEDKRAWHAGVSQWSKDANLNNSSIGIEIVNADGNIHPYPAEQIEAVVFLVKQLVERYEIDPVNVVGHSDVAPGRKMDPGALFPWKTLYDRGIGAWYDEADVDALRKTITAVPSVQQVKADLRTYGYGVDATAVADDAYKAVVNSFQRHFAPERIDGEMNLENYLILKALLKKYRS
ncbi:MAG: N-acetylmuramoyl-L-alanine amidase [Coraliomargaritaceae bacterium]